MARFKRIVLDRGHGELQGKDTSQTDGRVYTLPDGRIVNEGIENSKYVIELARQFKAKGFNVVFTVDPYKPENMSLTKRRNIANTFSDKETLLISVHNNAAKGIGTEAFTWVNTKSSDKVTEKVLQKIKDAGRHVRTENKTRLRKENKFYILGGKLPGFLLEMGFYDNPKDYDFLSNESNIKILCEAIVEGVIEHNKENG